MKKTPRIPSLRLAMPLATMLATLFYLAIPAAAQSCDRACLAGFVDQYLDALVATDMSLLPTTPDVRVTEDGVRLPLGDGLIRSVVAKGTYRLIVTDTETENVVFLGTMREEGRGGQGDPVVFAARLKVDGDAVSEIEATLIRNPQAALLLEAMKGPDPLYARPIPDNQVQSRGELIAAANAFYSGMEQNDGQGSYPFAASCERMENGMKVTNNPGHNPNTGFLSNTGTRADAKGKGKGKGGPPMPTGMNPSALGCREQMESGFYGFTTQVRDRRFVAVDPAYGLVVGFAYFDYAAGPHREVTLSDGSTVEAGPTRPFTAERVDVFKIASGEIERVESVWQQVPYRMGSGWSTHSASMSSEPVDYKGGR